jgi:hypothetical protein
VRDRRALLIAALGFAVVRVPEPLPPALLALRQWLGSWHDVCGFLSFTKLVEKAEGIRKLGIASSLRPDFLAQTAEYFRQDGG